MDLKTLCMNNLVEIIKNLPPLLREEIIQKSTRAIEKDAEQKAIKEIRRSMTFVIDDITNTLIKAHQNGTYITRPEYTKDMNDELYHTCVEVSEQFILKHGQQLIFPTQTRRHTYEDDWSEYF